MNDDDSYNSNLEQPDESEAAYFVWQYFAVTNDTDARKGGSKNAVCTFCDKASVDAAPPEQIASFFDQNDISYNVADSSSFACMIEKGIKYAKQNPLQSYTALSENGYQDLLDQAYKSIE